MRVLGIAAMFPSTFVLISTASSTRAYADIQAKVAWDGYLDYHGTCCNGNDMDGWRSKILVSVDVPGPYTCIINSVGAAPQDADNQIEVGDVICGSSHPGLDGTCSKNSEHQKFIESEYNNAYTCYAHGLFTLNNDDTFRASRIPPVVSGDVVYAGFINGTQYQSEYLTRSGNQTGNLYAFAQAETSSTSIPTCTNANHNSAFYFNTERYSYPNDALYPLNTAYDLFYDKNCFGKSAYDNQGFNVTLNN